MSTKNKLAKNLTKNSMGKSLLARKTKFIALATSFLIAQIGDITSAFAQDAATNKNDSWPWMLSDPNKNIKTPAEVQPELSKPRQELPSPTENTKPATTDKPSSEDQQILAPKQKSLPRLESEQAHSAGQAGQSGQRQVQPSVRDRIGERAGENSSKQEMPKSRILFGRLEEIASGTGAKFPVLKAQTAHMDLSGGRQMLKATARESVYSGQIVRSFPSDMSGTWGGILQLQQIQQDPLYYQLDDAEATQTASLMRPGIQGKVNFNFQNSASGITLEPAQLFFSAPMTESRMKGQLSQLSNGSLGIAGMGNMPGMNQMVKSMMMSMPYIWCVYLGQTQGVGLSGNSVQATLVRNDVRQLSPTVIEQQIISRELDTNPKTGQARSSYSESVVRFTRYNSSQQYVQAASVDYNSDKRFLRKMVFAGYVTKGVTEQVNPMGGLGDFSKMMPGGMPGSNPNDPNANPFKGLFGQ
jgi:hypothetical protein